MTSFIVACGGLVLLSGLFYLFPKKRPGGADEDLSAANLQWFRLREAELEREGGDALREDARLRLLEDEQQHVPLDKKKLPGQSLPLWILLALVALASSGLYYVLGAAPDVMIARQLDSLGQDTSPEDMQRLMQDIEARSAQRPDNLHYVAMLGRYHMGRQDYAKAAQVYGSLVQDAPQDAQALAHAAQAEYLAAGRTLSDAARMKAEQAVAIDPGQRTALGLLGMASFEQQQYRAAIAYWQRLLINEPADSESARMIASVMRIAQEKLGVAVQPQAGSVTSAAAPAAPAAVGSGVTVRVALPAGGAVDPADTVFILARNAASDSRMPIAVQRLLGSQLPITLRLDDSNSMADQKLSVTESIVVIVQVSPDGRPGEAGASWLGQAGPLAPTMGTEPVDIVLRPKNGG